jgi:hypothetical protein
VKRNVWSYEVTASTVDEVKVGAILIDYDDAGDEHRTWILYNPEANELKTGWTGRRGDRLCDACYNLPNPRIAVRGHEGAHGKKAPKYEPSWPAPAAAVVTAQSSEEPVSHGPFCNDGLPMPDQPPYECGGCGAAEAADDGECVLGGRWCETCKAWGEHHTDRHDQFVPADPVGEA